MNKEFEPTFTLALNHKSIADDPNLSVEEIETFAKNFSDSIMNFLKDDE